MDNFLMQFEVVDDRAKHHPKYTLRRGDKAVTLTKEFTANGRFVSIEMKFDNPDKFVKHIHQNVLSSKNTVKSAVFVQKNGKISPVGRAFPNDKLLRMYVRSAS